MGFLPLASSAACRPYLCSCLNGTSFSSLGRAAPAARKDAALSVRIIVLTAASSSYNCHQSSPRLLFCTSSSPTRAPTPRTTHQHGRIIKLDMTRAAHSRRFQFPTQWPLVVLQVKKSSGLKSKPKKKLFRFERRFYHVYKTSKTFGAQTKSYATLHVP